MFVAGIESRNLRHGGKVFSEALIRRQSERVKGFEKGLLSPALSSKGSKGGEGGPSERIGQDFGHMPWFDRSQMLDLMTATCSGGDYHCPERLPAHFLSQRFSHFQ